METFVKIGEYLEQSCLFLFGKSNIEHLNFPYLIFLISTSAIGLLCVTLDFAYYKTTNGKSVFNLSYIGWKGTILMFLFWGIGAGIVGFLAVRLELIIFSIKASIVMGLGWPLMFPRLYTYATAEINNREPEELFTSEMEEEPEEEIDEELDENKKVSNHKQKD